MYRSTHLAAAKHGLKLCDSLNIPRRCDWTRLSPSGQELKPPLARTSISGPPPSDPDAEAAQKQAQQRAEVAARALSLQSTRTPDMTKQDRQPQIGADRGGFVPPTDERRKLKGFDAIPEEQRFSPRRDIENRMSPPNPQLISPTAASLGKLNGNGSVDESSGTNSKLREGAQTSSRDTIFAPKSTLGHAHIEAEDRR